MTTGDHTPSDSTIPSPGGLVLAPFRALRYSSAAGTLAQLLCPPYDVIDATEQSALESSDPHNAVRLILPRDEPSSPGSRYRRAARTLVEWQAAGVLTRDGRPAVYVYEMDTGATITRGLLGALALADPDAGIVLPHENTMPGPVADRLALTEATEANLEPIYLVYDGGAVAGDLVAGVDAGQPLLTAHADGVTHRLWSITEPDELRALADELYPKHALIADGHHRYATYLSHQARRHRDTGGPGPWDFGLTFLVDARRFGPHVEAIHRVLPGLRLSDAAAALPPSITSGRLDGPAPSALRALADAGRDGPAFVLTDGEEWLLLRPAGPAAETGSALGRLDVTAAHRLLIDKSWGVPEDLVEYEHDVRRATARATAAHGTVLLLNPTSVDQVAAVASAGDRMPRKSTLFVPKPATGVVFRTQADHDALS
jgi:uncharacterized protein (DUF1015 family)